MIGDNSKFECFRAQLSKLAKNQSLILIEDIINKDAILKEIEKKKNLHIDEKCKLIRDLYILTQFFIPDKQIKLQEFFNGQIDYLLDLGQNTANICMNYGGDTVYIPNDRDLREQIIAANIWHCCYTSDGEGLAKFNEDQVDCVDVEIVTDVFVGNSTLDKTMRKIFIKNLKCTSFSCYTEYEGIKNDDDEDQ
ncbi:MAG: hypothetical protein EZS28_041420 [Streblomastix strix]|uniref:Uncharacterized protein n=1 Tax=Streblomastix strix TaxID=222440 RepID=A0A5J4TYM2_9EUKA|nr:MAG: hypothetical protein EZS28_041420 [Streblomastix strix]